MSELLTKPKSHVATLKFEVHIIVEKDEYGYIAYCPGLKGLAVEGDTEKEVLGNFCKAFISYMQSILKHKDPLPICSTFKVKSTVKPIIENIEVPILIDSNCNIYASV